MANNINKLSINGSSFNLRPIGTCATSASTTAKYVTCDNFELFDGASVLVKFTYANSAAAPTLNVNNTGAKAIKCFGTALTATNRTWKAGALIEFVYMTSDTSWHMMTTDNVDTDEDTTYSAGTGISFNGTTINHSNSVTAVTTAGLYKVKYDAQGHITGATAVGKADITNLGIPSKDTTYTAGTNISITNGVISATDTVYAGNYPVASGYTSTSTNKTSVAVSPNTYYRFGVSAKCTITHGSAKSGIVNEYVYEFKMNATASVVFPTSIVWANGIAPSCTNGKTYIVSVVNNLGVFAEF